MTASERWPEIEELLNAALELREEERSDFLRGACGGDEGLRRHVGALLRTHAESGPLDELARSLFSSGASRFRGDAGVAGRTIGPYRVADRLGGGGMGVVYEARDVRLDRAVALKFLTPELSLDPEATQRFLVEAQAAAALDHPNICTIYEVGETSDGQRFIAMPRYQGETLRSRMRRGRLPIDEIVSVALQVARGLAAAHDVGIVHRDVKPANIFLTEGGGVRLLDFGLAKRDDVSLTTLGAVPGTVAYMSPEQARGETVDPRTDLWSLGVVLYEMLAGERPFRGAHDQVVLRSILETEAPPIASKRPGVPPELARLVDRSLGRRLPDRPSSAREVVRELERLSPHPRGASDARDAPTASPAAASDRGPDGGETGRARSGVLPHGDRRPATIVVSSLDGYAALMESLPPEAVERLVQRIRREAGEVASRHEGVVIQASAEQLQIVFGLPATHEDDGRRAVRAALELRERVRALGADAAPGAGRELQLRTGIDTGQVVTHRPEGEGGGYRVAGGALQVAVALSAHAAADQVLLSPDCHRLVSPFFETSPEAPVAVRDRAQELVPHRVIGESGMHSRLDATGKSRLTTYTGRDAELGALRQSLDAALAGHGRVVTVVGEAGMGKSRLVYEFGHTLDRNAITVLQGRCQSYGGGIAYLPFIDALRQCLRLDDALGVAAQRGQVVARVREIAPELEEFTPLYLHLLSIPDEESPVSKHFQGEQFPLAMQEALAAMLLLTTRTTPAILLLEDWHWVDEASEAVLGHVADMVSNYPLLIVVTSRAERPPHADAAAPQTVLRLGPLEASSSAALARSALRAQSLPDALGPLLHERTGGNPFFLEEICQALLEDGTLRVERGRVEVVGALDTLELPDTIQAVIRARIDRLRPDARDVLRLASVVGREFTRAVVERTLEGNRQLQPSLQALKSAGLIQQTHVVPDAAYRFKHILTQEVAYASLLEHQRKLLHGRVGEAIETIHRDRIDEHLERLAHHFSRAEQWSKSVHYGVRSAERDTALSRFAEALQMLERTQAWVGRLEDGAERDERLAEILFRQERLCETLGRRGRQQRIIDELIPLLESAGDRAGLAEAFLRQGDVYTLLRRFDDAEEALSASLRLRRESGDALGERKTVRSLGLLRWHQGRHAEALEFVEEALRIDREHGDLEAIVGDVSNMGPVLRAMGRYDLAREHLEEALRLSEDALARDPSPRRVNELSVRQTYILQKLANVHRELGDDDTALAFLERARALTTERRLPIQHSYHLTTIAHIYLKAGKVEESLQLYHESIELTRRARFVPGLAQSLRFTGEVLLGLERRAEALPLVQEAASLFAQLKDRATEALMWCHVARIHEQEARDPDAIAAWGKARSLGQEAREAKVQLEALEGLARVTRRHIGEPSLALAYYRDALQLARSLEDDACEGRLRNALGIIEWSRGEFEEALAHYERAREIYGGPGDGEELGIVLNSIGVTLRDLGRHGEAVTRLQEALAVHRTARQPRLEGHALAVLGDVYSATGESGEALQCYERSLAIRVRIGDRRGEGWMSLRVAHMELARGLVERGRTRLRDAAAIASAEGDRELTAACEQLRYLPAL